MAATPTMQINKTQLISVLFEEDELDIADTTLQLLFWGHVQADLV